MAQEYDELYSERLTLYFFGQSAAGWNGERPGRSEAAQAKVQWQGAFRDAR